ncbi:DivIVA domain-containing protein [Microbispora sp. RL4-1S]|uniref:Cell wall synthesis protein Wag31 n=1 Tax=Microbispora oryzae TaxID=2806554 RepID=A0A941AIU1_9ACTN|nr:DivIVA domain-containing protein [Microbispora oryzae]MBP2705536.1 DivIVA domain-containing protein [Microbispora oryzae]
MYEAHGHEGDEGRDGHQGHHGHGHGHHGREALDELGDVGSGQARTGVLSPAAVRNQVFTVVRLREGYDLAEVDTFLGLVEITLSTLLRDNDDLRRRLKAVVQLSRQARPPASVKAGRVVEIAHEAAERVIDMACQEAEAVLAQVRAQAEEMEREAAERADALRREAGRAQRDALERRLESLQTFVADFGGRLKAGLGGSPDLLEELLDDLRARIGPLEPERPERGERGERTERGEEDEGVPSPYTAGAQRTPAAATVDDTIGLDIFEGVRVITPGDR